MRNREYRLLEAIAENELTTQAGLANQLGIAVGSVNWYIRRLIRRGYLKATRLDRTRLRYNLTPQGMQAFTRNAAQYMRDSLSVYSKFRTEARKIAEELLQRKIEQVYIQGDNEQTDILRLTLLEHGIFENDEPDRWKVISRDFGYKLIKIPASRNSTIEGPRK